MAKKRIITNPNLLVEELDGKLTLKVKDGGTNRNVAVAQGNVTGGSLVEVTYDELVLLRDNNKLIPGAKYRITDYETIVDESKGVKSAGHRFDIIVEALDDHTLSENASAIQQKDGINRKTMLVVLDDGDEEYEYVRVPEYDDIVDDGCVWAFNINNPSDDYIVTPDENVNVGDDVINYEGGDEYHCTITALGEKTTDYFGESKLAAWRLKYSIDNDDKVLPFVSYGQIEHTEITFISEIDHHDGTYWLFDVVSITDSYWKLAMMRQGEYFNRYVYCAPIDPLPDHGQGQSVYLYEDSSLTQLYTSMYCENFQEEYYPSKHSSKGMIYYMKDEFCNEAPYDFKNLLFKSGEDFDITGSVTVGGVVCNFVRWYNNKDCNIAIFDNNYYIPFDTAEKLLNATSIFSGKVDCDTGFGSMITSNDLQVVSTVDIYAYTFNIEDGNDYSLSGYCKDNSIYYPTNFKDLPFTIFNFDYYGYDFIACTSLATGRVFHIDDLYYGEDFSK